MSCISAKRQVLTRLLTAITEGSTTGDCYPFVCYGLFCPKLTSTGFYVRSGTPNYSPGPTHKLTIGLCSFYGCTWLFIRSRTHDNPNCAYTSGPTHNSAYILDPRRVAYHNAFSDRQVEIGANYSPPVTSGLLDFLYNAVFLFLPYFYRFRVLQVLRGVKLTENEIVYRFNSGRQESAAPRSWEEVKRSWNEFIDSVLKEWKTLNIVSALLLSCVCYYLKTMRLKICNTVQSITFSSLGDMAIILYSAQHSCLLSALSLVSRLAAYTRYVLKRCGVLIRPCNGHRSVPIIPVLEFSSRPITRMHSTLPTQSGGTLISCSLYLRFG